MAETKVSQNEVDLGAQGASVATSEATSSTTYTDLTTTTDTVTVVIGINGKAWVAVSGHMANNTTGALGYISFVASGANTIVASDARAFYLGALTGLSQGQGTWGKLLTGLTPGSTVFKMKYRVSTGSASFDSREISVIPV